MRIGIVGLPNSTKTTVFNALTRGDAQTEAAGGARFHVERATVEVPDPRVDALAAMFQPKKVTRAHVEYQDIGGMARGIASGGLAGEITNALAQNDALLHVVRAFEDDEVPHPELTVDPARDITAVDAEFLLSDLIVVERRIERLDDSLKRPIAAAEKDAFSREREVLARLRTALEAETPIRDLGLSEAEKHMLRGFQFLTAKPVLVVVNIGDEEPSAVVEGLEYPHADSEVLRLRGRLEMELAQLDETDRSEFLAEYGIDEPGLDRVIRASYRLLGLQSFFTVGEDEVRAWTVPIGAKAVEAAAAIHTDLARGFIRAEVIEHDRLLEAGSMAAARSAGALRVEGRDYVVQDGDVLHVRFNV